MSHEPQILETDLQSQRSEETQLQEFYFENNQRQKSLLLKIWTISIKHSMSLNRNISAYSSNPSSQLESNPI